MAEDAGSSRDGKNAIFEVKHALVGNANEGGGHGVCKELVLGLDGVVEGFFVNVAHAIEHKFWIREVGFLEDVCHDASNRTLNLEIIGFCAKASLVWEKSRGKQPCSAPWQNNRNIFRDFLSSVRITPFFPHFSIHF